MILLVCSAWTPPDLYDEDYNKSIGFWENLGQIVGTDGLPRPDVKFYSEGGFPRAYPRAGSHQGGEGVRRPESRRHTNARIGSTHLV